MKNKQTFTFTRAAMTLLLMMLTTVTTWADNYVTLTSTTSTKPSWTNGNTYVANGKVNIANRITVTGNVTLILNDGCTLTAPNGIEVREGNSLIIEGGTNGTGTLTIEGGTRAGIGGGYKKVGINKYPTRYGNITINGGTVNVKGGDQCAGIGGDFYSELTDCGTITINGGIVNATGGNKASGIGGGNCGDGAKGGCGDIVINGGQVTATGGYDAPGIGPSNGAADTSGSLVLGWTNTTDFIKVTGVKSNLNVVYGFSDRLKSINFAEEDKKFNISGGGEATIKDITNLESVELIPKGSEQHQLSVATISGISASYDLTGSYLDIPFSVSDAEENTLTLGTDYTATLGTIALNSASIHITEGGKYTLTVTGMGSYAGSKSVDFEVISIGFKKDANGVDYINMPKTGIYYDANIPSGVSSFNVYDDGGAKAKYSNSYDGGLVLTAPDHYVLQLTGTVTAEVQVNNPLDYLMVYDGGSTSAQKIGDKYGSESGANIGTLISSGKQMTLTFHSDNSGPKDGLDLKVTLKRDIMSCDIANIDDQTYTGSAFEPAVVITYEGTALVKDVDYEVTYSDKTIVGTATITITGKGNYAGTTSKTFNIVKATPTVSAPAAVENLIYTGGSLNLVAAGTTDFGTLVYSLDSENYSEDIPTATNAGTYTVYYKVAGDANHNDVSGSIEVTITPKPVTNDNITVTIPSQTWTGSELTPVITVKDGEKMLALGTDYEVAYSNNFNVGTATATITGKGNYSDSKEATFTIDKATPYVKTAPTASAITYGQRLSDSNLNDGVIQYSESKETPVAGTFAWTNRTVKPSVTDSENTEYEVTFTPTDSENFRSVTTNVTLKVNKATPTVSAPAVVENLIYTGGSLNLVAAGTTDFGTLLYSLDGESYSADIPTGKDAGTYTIYYKVEGSSNWDAVDAASVEATIMGNYKFEYANNNYSQDYAQDFIESMDVVVKDGETGLQIGTDFLYGSVTMANGDPIQESAIGDECKVEIVGRGNYVGSKWATFKIVAPDANGTWGDLTWAFHDGTLTISPAENVQTPVAMKKAAKGEYPWFSVANYIQTITIEEGVSTVADDAFNRVTESNVYGNVNALNLPTTLTTIGEYAFAYCTGLTVELKDFAGKTYPANAFTQVGCVVGTLLDNDDNANTIDVMEVASTNNITISGRTLYKDGEWNTICLPFDLSAEQIAASPLAGCALKELVTGETGFDASTGTLTLNFKDVTAIEAGKPYLIKWESGDNITDPVFTGVSVSSESHNATSNDGGKVQFCGIYEPVELEAGDKSIFYLGANNQLYWPSKARTMNAFRAYFRVSGGYKVREIRMNLGDDVTGVTLIDNGQLTIDNYSGATYNLSGQKVSDDYKGIVIKNGKKIAK